MKFPVVVQHRHVHLSEADARALFGEQGSLPDCEPEREKCESKAFTLPSGVKQTRAHNLDREIDQRSQFVLNQTISVHGPKGFFQEVSVIGPSRAQTQVELSSSDAFSIGVNAPLRLSGDLDRTATVILKTALGEIQAKSSTIIPIRHLHLPPQLAQELGVTHHEVVTVKAVGREHVVFEHTVVRVHPTFLPAFHLTKDEAAPHWIQSGDFVTL